MKTFRLKVQAKTKAHVRPRHKITTLCVCLDVFASPVRTQRDGSPHTKKALKYFESKETFFSIVVQSSKQVASFRIPGTHLEKLTFKFELEKNPMSSRAQCTGPTGLS